jgi:pyrimidine operon attenuation protein/uracil phosphoribosyltransferase
MGKTGDKTRSKVQGKVVMTASEIDLVLARIAAEILERLGPGEDFAVVGIRRCGVHLAQRLCRKVEATRRRAVPLGILDITLYRDDLTAAGGNRPTLRETRIDFDVNDRSLILVDDVLFTGRTIRAALDGLVDLGRPKRVQLAVLVDRGHRELPIQADYVGKVVQTEASDDVDVRLAEEGQAEGVFIKGASKNLADKASPQVEKRSLLRQTSIFDQGAT